MKTKFFSMATFILFFLFLGCRDLGPHDLNDTPDDVNPNHPSHPNNFHAFTGLPLDRNGYTDLSALVNTKGLYESSRVIYVSSSEGDDETARIYSKNSLEVDGDPFKPMGIIRPYATLEAAKQQIRMGEADILLLKRGDVWDHGLGGWCLAGGKSNLERSIVAAYGNSGMRPQIRGRSFSNLLYIGNCPENASRFMIFSDLDSYPSHRDPHSSDYEVIQDSGVEAIGIVSNLEDILFENINTRFGQVNIQAGSERMSRIAFRRNIVSENYNTDFFASGLYIHGVDGLLVEENTFDSNGFNSIIPGAEERVFNHNVYIQHTNRNVQVRENITTNGSATGVQLRPGGELFNNLFLNEAVPGFISGAGGEMSYNVVIGGKDPSFGGRSWGLADSSTGTVEVYRNMVIHKRPNLNPSYGFEFHNYDLSNPDNADPALDRGPKRVRFFENIVYNWSGYGMAIYAPDSLVSSLEVFKNQFSVGDYNIIEKSNGIDTSKYFFRENTYYGPRNLPFYSGGGRNFQEWSVHANDMNSIFSMPAYNDSSRNIESYMDSMGLTPTLEAFMSRVKAQSRWSWDGRFTSSETNNYLRDGFGVQNP